MYSKLGNNIISQLKIDETILLNIVLLDLQSKLGQKCDISSITFQTPNGD